MRAVLAGLALLLVPAVVSAQDTFRDDDFDFSMDVPPGMALTTPEEQEAAGGPVFENVTRGEAGDAPIAHTHIWRDLTGRERSISLLLRDGPFPFSGPDEFKEAVQATMGLTVDGEQQLTPPDYRYGMRIEGTIERGDGAIVRQTEVFMPISVEPPRSLNLRFQALDVDWSLVWPEFEASLKSIDIPQPAAGMGGAQPPGGRARQPRVAPAPAGAGGVDRYVANETWDSLEVTGSLVLAVVLLMGLFLGGGRSAPAA